MAQLKTRRGIVTNVHRGTVAVYVEAALPRKGGKDLPTYCVLTVEKTNCRFGRLDNVEWCPSQGSARVMGMGGRTRVVELELIEESMGVKLRAGLEDTRIQVPCNFPDVVTDDDIFEE